MQVSAEIRWFWHTPSTETEDWSPNGLKNWFCTGDAHGAIEAGGGKERKDEYLRAQNQIELSLKRRGNKKGTEVKGLITVVWNGLVVSPFVGPIEIWTKWTSEPLELNSNSTITVVKQRWLRKFDTSTPSPKEIPLNDDEKPSDEKLPLPTLGCNVELTRIELPSKDVWWTFGFETFGSLSTIENDLRAVATTLANRCPPSLEGGLIASYPAWLSTLEDSHINE